MESFKLDVRFNYLNIECVQFPQNAESFCFQQTIKHSVHGPVVKVCKGAVSGIIENAIVKIFSGG